MNLPDESNANIVTASAPGRMDVMGGIADYSGSLLLQMPIRERTYVTAQKNKDEWISIRSKRNRGKEVACKIPCSDIAERSLKELADMLKQNEQGDWAAYILGSVAVLYAEKLIPVTGLTIDIRSDIPEGKGVSSSAALEVAVLTALLKLFQVKTAPFVIPLLAQKAENTVVGAPCGLMDQLSTCFGEKGKLLPIVCQPCSIEKSIPLPRDLRLCAIDSGVRHAVSGNSYSGVRTAAFMAYTFIAQAEGCTKETLLAARHTGDWSALPYGGYLSNIPLSHFQRHYLHQLPEKIRGDAFMEQYGGHTDLVTSISGGQWYALRACALHPVEENNRIRLFRELLQSNQRKGGHDYFQLLGELMLQSHAGYGSVGLGNEKTDLLVDMLMDKGPALGIYGARVSGGGSGGTVVVLCKGAGGVRSAKEVWKQYAKAEKAKTAFFYGSSKGANYE